MSEVVSINGKQYDCPLDVTLDVVGGKWKLEILWFLMEKTMRFGELKRLCKSVTQKMLSQQLKELEKDGLVHRKVFAEVPPRVEYSLSNLGRSLIPILQTMYDWGKKYASDCNGPPQL